MYNAYTAEFNQNLIKNEAWARIAESNLMLACATGEKASAQKLMGGYWDFVNNFPEVIRQAYSSIPEGVDPKTRRFLTKSSKILSGLLSEMEEDEKSHRALWLISAKKVGMDERDLSGYRVTPEVARLTSMMRNETDYTKKMLYFVGVEVVAEGISDYLLNQPAFVSTMTKKGMAWFSTHMIHDHGATVHEDLAYDLAKKVAAARGLKLSHHDASSHVLECVDAFIEAADSLV